MKRFLNFAVFALMFCWHAGAQEPRSLTGTEAEGYRGIWFTIGQVRSGFGPKYSGGLGTYTMKHIPVAVYAAEADKTFFVYGGTPAADRKYLLCTVGCYDHKTGMLRRPVVVCDKGVNNVHDPHDDPTIQIDKEGYVWIFVAGRGNTRPGIRYRSRKPLIVTTNLTLTELKKPQDTAHARIYDRLLELCTPIACTGPSMRKDIGQAKLNLLKTLLA